MPATQRKNIDAPDETRKFVSNGHVDLVSVGEINFGRATFEPGWRWSEHVAPIAGTTSCQAHHNGYIVSGRMAVRMDDGSEVELVPGDVFVTPAGHDAWVVGSEPCIAFDFSSGI